MNLAPTLGMLLLSLFVAVPIMVAGYFGWTAGQRELVSFLDSLDFRRTLMDGMLGFLLFAVAGSGLRWRCSGQSAARFESARHGCRLTHGGVLE